MYQHICINNSYCKNQTPPRSDQWYVVHVRMTYSQLVKYVICDAQNATYSSTDKKAFNRNSSLAIDNHFVNELQNVSPNCCNNSILTVPTTLGQSSEAFCSKKHHP